MEKLQIAKYGMMQVTAIVYGVLASGAAVKINRSWLDEGYIMPDTFYRAIFYRDYGIYCLGFVVIWVVLVSYLSSPLSKWDFQESNLSVTGLVLTLIFAIVGTSIAISGATPPPHLITGVSVP